MVSAETPAASQPDAILEAGLKFARQQYQARRTANP
jgi:hypothetical protein